MMKLMNRTQVTTVKRVNTINQRPTRYLGVDGQIFTNKLDRDLYDLAMGSKDIINKVVNLVSQLVDYDDQASHLTNINFTGFGIGQGLKTPESVLLGKLLDATGFVTNQHQRYLSIYGVKVEPSDRISNKFTKWFNY